MHCVGLQTCRKPREYSTMVKKSPLEENSLETMNEVSIELRVKINWSENRTDLHKVIGRSRDGDFRHHETRSEPSSDSDWFNFNFEKETCNELARDHRTRSTLWFLMTFFLWCGWVIKLDDSASSCMWSHALNTLQYHTQDNWELFSVRVLMGAQNVLSWIVHAKSHWTCQIFLPFFRVWFKDLFFTWNHKNWFSHRHRKFRDWFSSRFDARISLLKRLELLRPLQAFQKCSTRKMFVASVWSMKKHFQANHVEVNK